MTEQTEDPFSLHDPALDDWRRDAEAALEASRQRRERARQEEARRLLPPGHRAALLILAVALICMGVVALIAFLIVGMPLATPTGGQ